MKHWKCTKCHHEWDGGINICDWCDARGEIIGTVKVLSFHEMTMKYSRDKRLH